MTNWTPVKNNLSISVDMKRKPEVVNYQLNYMQVRN